MDPWDHSGRTSRARASSAIYLLVVKFNDVIEPISFGRTIFNNRAIFKKHLLYIPSIILPSRIRR